MRARASRVLRRLRGNRARTTGSQSFRPTGRQGAGIVMTGEFRVNSGAWNTSRVGTRPPDGSPRTSARELQRRQPLAEALGPGRAPAHENWNIGAQLQSNPREFRRPEARLPTVGPGPAASSRHRNCRRRAHRRAEFACGPGCAPPGPAAGLLERPRGAHAEVVIGRNAAPAAGPMSSSTRDLTVVGRSRKPDRRAGRSAGTRSAAGDSRRRGARSRAGTGSASRAPATIAALLGVMAHSPTSTR